MSSFLLAWNPKRWDWENLSTEVARTLLGQHVRMQWRCMNRHVRPDNRVFVVHLGKKPRGIMASGIAVSGPQGRAHSDKRRGKKGEPSSWIECAFDRILDPRVDELLSISTLQRAGLAGVCWTPQGSGISIPDEASDVLIKLWEKHIVRPITQVKSMAPGGAMEGELTSRMVRHRRREYALRDAKLDEIRRKKKGRLVCQVPGCGFDFEKTYGVIGLGYAQVHHLNPLADRTEASETKLTDLAVVCANCHAMIHRGGKCRRLDSLVR